MEKARVATFAVVSAWTSSKSSYCLWFTPIICGHPPRSKPEFCSERFRAQPSQGTGEFLLLKQTSCFVVSLHLRLTPSSWPEVLVQIFRLSFSSLHAVYRSPAAAQCCCADICSDQRQEITR